MTIIDNKLEIILQLYQYAFIQSKGFGFCQFPYSGAIEWGTTFRIELGTVQLHYRGRSTLRHKAHGTLCNVMIG